MKQTIQENEIRQKYAGLTYEELIEAAQRDNLSDLAFIMAQPELHEEFKEFISDRNSIIPDEEAAELFLEQKEIRMMNLMEDESFFLLEGLL